MVIHVYEQNRVIDSKLLILGGGEGGDGAVTCAINNGVTSFVEFKTEQS